jgi:hypothetical protein
VAALSCRSIHLKTNEQRRRSFLVWSTVEFELIFGMDAQSVLTLLCGVAGCSGESHFAGVPGTSTNQPPTTYGSMGSSVSGLTHETKVKDCEMTIQRAAARWKEMGQTAAPPDFITLAKRLIAARRKAMRARLAKLREPLTIELSAHEIENAEARLAALEDRGVAGILREFALPESFAPPLGA